MDMLHWLLAKLEVLRTIRRDERAVTAMEYALIGALIAVVIVVAVSTLGTTISKTFLSINGALPTK